MAKATLINSSRNGYGCWVAEYKLKPPYRGHHNVIVAAWRDCDGDYQTAVMEKELNRIGSQNLLSKSFSGQNRHGDALASLGYQSE